MDAEIMSFLLSIIAGVISGLAILPIASDGIRSKLFGRKKVAMLNAKRELIETVNGMLLSGQTINEHTYKILSENISKKYDVPISVLGDKDNTIVMILQAINSSKMLPNHLKKQISGRLQAQLDGYSDSGYESTNEFEVENEMATEILSEWHENNGSQEGIGSSALERQLIAFIVLAVGIVVTMIVYMLESYILFPIILCVSAFLICINILTSLMGTTEPKNIEFFRRLVYKIILLIVLIVFLIVLIVFFDSFNRIF